MYVYIFILGTIIWWLWTDTYDKTVFFLQSAWNNDQSSLDTSKYNILLYKSSAETVKYYIYARSLMFSFWLSLVKLFVSMFSLDVLFPFYYYYYYYCHEKGFKQPYVSDDGSKNTQCLIDN